MASHFEFGVAYVCAMKIVLVSSLAHLSAAGVDVMMTIFCDFRQFSAKKLAFLSKTNVMIKILHN
jgi:hypothetical protein